MDWKRPALGSKRRFLRYHASPFRMPSGHFRRGNEQLARGCALGNLRQKYIRPDGAKAILHTVMFLPFHNAFIAC